VSQVAEVPEEMLRARRTAALTRAAVGLCGVVLIVHTQNLANAPGLALIGLGIVVLSAFVQYALPRPRWLVLEESLAGLAGLLVIGSGHERVTIISLLWLAGVASGVLARGGRMYWVGRALMLIGLALPVIRERQASLPYFAFIVATLALLLTCGRVTRELRGMLERARHDADHDSLTGALSRAAFRSGLDQLAGDAAESELAVLLVDLDGFGSINKTSGHSAGDAALVAVVDRARGMVADGDLIGRLGGDEFALAVRDPDPVALGRQLLTELDAPGDAHPALAASIGVARMPADGQDAESVLRAVDVALRVAKRTGTRTVSLYAGGSFSEGGGGARADLERLIGGDGIAIAVQPIVNVPETSLHGYEALARFQTGGTQSPLHWFALADEFGLRDELELACLRAALGLFTRRPAGTVFSVNLSCPLLLDVRTERLLSGCSSLSGLILELTENSLVEDSPGMHARISELIGRGARFAVDDVGAGYSGLRQLTTVRPSYLKLDRSLISAIDEDPDRGALVSAMLGYARQTGSQLVAEGVETEAELETLAQLGVRLVQGFYLGRPAWPWPGVTPPVPLSGARPEPAGAESV
jgi:diguanylate cyclase (GGDEF)-like protein